MQLRKIRLDPVIIFYSARAELSAILYQFCIQKSTCFMPETAVNRISFFLNKSGIVRLRFTFANRIWNICKPTNLLLLPSSPLSIQIFFCLLNKHKNPFKPDIGFSTLELTTMTRQSCIKQTCSCCVVVKTTEIEKKRKWLEKMTSYLRGDTVQRKRMSRQSKRLSSFLFPNTAPLAR